MVEGTKLGPTEMHWLLDHDPEVLPGLCSLKEIAPEKAIAA